MSTLSGKRCEATQRYSDVEKKLDMLFGISVEFHHRLLSILQKGDSIIPVAMHHTDLLTQMDVFVNEEDVGKNRGLLATYRPRASGEYLVLRMQGQEIIGISEPSRSLLRVFSSVPGELYIRGNRLYSFARFHHSELMKISDITSGRAVAGSHPRVEFLGMSPGGSKILDRVNSRIKLTAVSFDFAREFDSLNETTLPHIGEVNIELLTSEKYRVVLHPETPTEWGKHCTTISKEEGIFALAGTIRMLKDLYVSCNEMHIPIVASISKQRVGRILVTEFIPSAFKDDFVETLFEVSAKYPDLDIFLAHVSEYGKSTWDWL